MNDLEPCPSAETKDHAPRRLPPDPEGMNDERASWADEVLQRFRALTGTDYEDALGDLLCDLMHWSDRNNFDFGLALQRAEGHYEAETGSDSSTNTKGDRQ
jgi:hypothetical protein